jgi:hypothetical protein
MERIADLLGSHPKFAKKCALLVNPDHVVRFGLARMLTSLAEFKMVEFSLFFKLDDAIKYMSS